MTTRENTKSRMPAANVAANNSTGHLERINALLKWWGAPVVDFSTNESQLRCLQEFTDGIQSLYRDASGCQRHLFGETSRDLTAGVTHLSWPRKPSELLDIQSVMAAKLLDGMSHQSRLWIDVAAGLADRYSAFAKGTAELCYRQHIRDESDA